MRYILKNLRQNELLQSIEEEEEEDDEDDSEGDSENEDGDDDDSKDDNGSKDDVNNGQSIDAADKELASSTSNYEDAHTITNMTRRPAQRNSVNCQDVQQPSCSRFSLSFKDVEDSIRPYDGSGNVSIQFWINEFEEMAALMQWDEQEKTIFAKRSLKGLAKMFVLSEHGLTTWAKLKKALTDEFSEQTNSAKLHQMLTER